MALAAGCRPYNCLIIANQDQRVWSLLPQPIAKKIQAIAYRLVSPLSHFRSFLGDSWVRWRLHTVALLVACAIVFTALIPTAGINQCIGMRRS
jgi:hypothetical protein